MNGDAVDKVMSLLHHRALKASIVTLTEKVISGEVNFGQCQGAVLALADLIKSNPEGRSESDQQVLVDKLSFFAMHAMMVAKMGGGYETGVVKLREASAQLCNLID